jgi:hypothetical protein
MQPPPEKGCSFLSFVSPSSAIPSTYNITLQGFTYNMTPLQLPLLSQDNPLRVSLKWNIPNLYGTSTYSKISLPLAPHSHYLSLMSPTASLVLVALWIAVWERSSSLQVPGEPAALIDQEQ